MNELIIFSLFILFPVSVFVIAGLFWHFLSERTKRKLLFYQQKLKYRYGPQQIETPFGEWRYPVMFLAISSLVFILLFTGFGVQINSHTGEVVMEMDWSKWIDEKTGLFDPWVYDPFAVWVQNNRLEVLGMMIAGFYGTMCIFIYFWFQYCKWKWQNIPIEKRIVEKTYKVKIPNNRLYHIELLKKRR